MSISRRKALSLLCHQGLPYVGMGFTFSQLSSGCLQDSLGSPQPSVRKQQNLLQESGNFLEEVQRLHQLAIPKSSYRYQVPHQNELNRFRYLAKALAVEDIASALVQAESLHYEVVKFTDLTTRQVFYGLREQKGRHRRGWGSYFINPTARIQALLEAPHILFDRFSDEIAAAAFLAASAYGILLAGAHRHANGPDTADVCKHPDSVFHIMHQAWVSPGMKTCQIHGFDGSTKPSFPAGTDIVLSNGQGQISPEIADLNQRLAQNHFQSYVYKQLPSKSRKDSPIQPGLLGNRFRALGATHNIQGIYCRQVGTTFTHVELSEQIRSTATQRSQIARIIAESAQATT